MSKTTRLKRVLRICALKQEACDRDLATLMAEDNALGEELHRLLMAPHCADFRTTAWRSTRQIALQSRRAALVSQISDARAACARAVGRHDAVNKLLEKAKAAEELEAARREEATHVPTCPVAPHR